MTDIWPDEEPVQMRSSKWTELEFKVFQILPNPGYIAIFGDENGEFTAKIDFIGLARVYEKSMKQSDGKATLSKTEDLGTEIVGIKLTDKGTFDVVDGEENFLRIEKIHKVSLALEKLKEEILRNGKDWTEIVSKAKCNKTVKELAQLGLSVLTNDEM